MSTEDEAIAQRVIAMCHDVTATPNNDGSKPSMVDFILTRAAGLVGCAEISRITDPEGHRGEHILGGQDIEAPALRWTWDCGAGSKRLRRGDNARIVPILARLEAEGIERIDTFNADARKREILRRATADLAEFGVTYARVVGHKTSSTWRLVMATVTGWPP